MHHNSGINKLLKIPMVTIKPIPAFDDNYIWALHNNDNNQVLVVDPGDATPVREHLRESGSTLNTILITHWHNDHIGGVTSLVEEYGCDVIGPHSDRIPQVKSAVEDGEKIEVLGVDFDVIEVPGHTMEHIAYVATSDDILFCGDTLFAAGCGRMFEGTPPVFLRSLNKLAVLSDNMRVFCTHEYTLANLHFAAAVEPENDQVINRLREVDELRKNNQITLPSTIGLEKATNPFLRTSALNVIKSALNQGAPSDDPVDVFATLREWKNEF